jgi:hypothetical protein
MHFSKQSKYDLKALDGRVRVIEGIHESEVSQRTCISFAHIYPFSLYVMLILKYQNLLPFSYAILNCYFYILSQSVKHDGSLINSNLLYVWKVSFSSLSYMLTTGLADCWV